MTEKEILDMAFAAFDKGEVCKIKLPPANKIHDFNMAVNSLASEGNIVISERNMTFITLELTEKALEMYI
ncbi:MAG: hypothetical protein IJR59_05140 [Firmicutes bacterium]|nr:hypothetical protein [Bacillota bacterium]